LAIRDRHICLFLAGNGDPESPERIVNLENPRAKLEIEPDTPSRGLSFWHSKL
jgi:hypothetical protein